MKLPNPIKRFVKKNYKTSLMWFLTFFIAFSFITSTIQLNTDATDQSAMEIYIASEEGLMNKGVTKGINNMLYGYNSAGGYQESADGGQGAISAVTSLTYNLYTEPPASGLVWAQNEINKIRGFESITVHAQSDPADANYYYPGLGYNTLRPVIALWQWSRNLVYFIFIIIMIAIAFMVLFRTSMGGQTLVTISNSLPSIMWALLLVTLSYPISGLAIDIVTIGSGFVQSVLITAPNAPGRAFVDGYNLGYDKPDINYLQPDDPQMSLWSIWGTSNADICEGEGCSGLSIIPDAGKSEGIFGTILSAVDILTGLVSTTIGGKSSLLQALLGIAVLQAGLKLFLALLKEYAYLVLIPIVSPFIFLTAAFPTKTGTVLWKFVLGLLKSSLSFVVVYAIFLFMVILGHSASLDGVYSSVTELSLTPPLLGYSHSQVSGGTNVIIPVLLYLLFMFTPQIPDMLQKALQAPQAGEFLSSSMSRAGSSVMKVSSGAKGLASTFRERRKKGQ